MQKKILSFIFVFSVIGNAMAASSSSVWSIGLRGGGNMYLSSGDVKSHLGYGGNLDLGFTQYWKSHKTDVGIHTGVSFGGCFNQLSCPVNRQFTNYDYLGNKIIYTILADNANLRVTSLPQLEVPLMLAIRKNQVFFNIGGKFMMPLRDTYKQSVENAVIDAYYEKIDVHVINRLITGTTDGIDKSGTNCLPKYNILVGAELGYEWQMHHGGLFGIGIYADYSPWNSLKTSKTEYIIEVAPISDPNYPPAKVTVNPLTTSSAKKLLFCDFGVKIYFGIANEKRTCHCLVM